MSIFINIFQYYQMTRESKRILIKWIKSYFSSIHYYFSISSNSFHYKNSGIFIWHLPPPPPTTICFEMCMYMCREPDSRFNKLREVLHNILLVFNLWQSIKENKLNQVHYKCFIIYLKCTYIYGFIGILYKHLLNNNQLCLSFLFQCFLIFVTKFLLIFKWIFA